MLAAAEAEEEYHNAAFNNEEYLWWMSTENDALLKRASAADEEALPGTLAALVAKSNAETMLHGTFVAPPVAASTLEKQDWLAAPKRIPQESLFVCIGVTTANVRSGEALQFKYQHRVSVDRPVLDTQYSYNRRYRYSYITLFAPDGTRHYVRSTNGCLQGARETVTVVLPLDHTYSSSYEIPSEALYERVLATANYPYEALFTDYTKASFKVEQQTPVIVVAKDASPVLTLTGRGEFTPCASWIKLRALEGEIHWFLDVNAVARHVKQNRQFPEFILSVLQSVMKPYFEPVTQGENNDVELVDTSDELLAPQPPDFGLTLHDFQRRTLTWMVRTETLGQPLKFPCVQLGPFGPFVFLGTQEVVHLIGWQWRAPDTWCHFARESVVRSGLLCDKVGRGKTVTMLALVRARPAPELTEEEMSISNGGYFKSRATLVICPANLTDQWLNETKRCLGMDSKVCVISTINEHQQYQQSQIALYDVVIVSVAFLSGNSNYKLWLSRGRSGNRIDFARVKWHRVIVDEYHEIMQQPDYRGKAVRLGNTRSILSQMTEVEHIWGMSGTPNLDATFGACELLHVNESAVAVLDPKDSSWNMSVSQRQSFWSAISRRNEPDMALPPLRHKLVLVRPSPEELALQATLVGNTLQQLMLCNHHALGELVEAILNQGPSNENESLTPNAPLTVEEVSNRLQTHRLQALESMEYNNNKDKEQKRDAIHRQRRVAWESRYEEQFKARKALRKSWREKRSKHQEKQDEPPFPENDDDLYEGFDPTQPPFTVKGKYDDELIRKWAEYNYFENVLNCLRKCRDGEPMDCCICLENIDLTVTMLPCGHMYCYKCLDELGRRSNIQQRCPQCQRPIEKDKWLKVDLTPPPPEKTVIEEVIEEAEENANQLNGLDLKSFGSKIGAIAKFIQDTIQEQDESRFILFIQFRRLAELVAQALCELGIQNVQVRGTVRQRQLALSQFKNGLCRVVILSAESSVSGIHLPEATHVLLMHPFYMEGNEAYAGRALDAEKQAIARAHRFGQTREVTVVRFILQKTIEESLHALRVDLQ